MSFIFAFGICTPIFEWALWIGSFRVRSFSSNLWSSVIGPATFAPGLTSRISSIALWIASRDSCGSSCFSNR